ncbi:hypothetical protein MJO28_016412 [Puccinia striiformis f. sp. tritici]|uniref:Uncharacterized protein n=1 Tax=Puccinia striiformis f. sp. tritici TaxID=168172 RepID=A0ACC0DNX0_9BASI|nr:hypothetical protein MJO29_016222 [Puccinia striiformis f. sp. tritici]KAI7935541.1 hypothetical protein MJO28_016412 [Puccinia striiformis f. sp. tritici]
MLFLNFSLAIAVLSMVQGRSAAVNSFQCKNSDKSQALCSHANGDTTVVEKAYPDGLGYYCSSNIKDAKQNCCNADFKIGSNRRPRIPESPRQSKRVPCPKTAMLRWSRHSSAPILIRPKLCAPSSRVLPRDVSLNHLDRAQSLVHPEEMQHNIDFDCAFPLVKPFPSGRNYFCPVWLVNPLKSCCNTDFKIKLNLSICYPETTRQCPPVPFPVTANRLAESVVKPGAKPNKWPTDLKTISEPRFLVTMVSSASCTPAACTNLSYLHQSRFCYDNSHLSRITRVMLVITASRYDTVLVSTHNETIQQSTSALVCLVSLFPLAFAPHDLPRITKLPSGVRRFRLSAVVPSNRTLPVIRSLSRPGPDATCIHTLVQIAPLPSGWDPPASNGRRWAGIHVWIGLHMKGLPQATGCDMFPPTHYTRDRAGCATGTTGQIRDGRGCLLTLSVPTNVC